MNPTENQNTHKKYKRYDEAFKRQAVEHWMLSGKSGRQVAQELGINLQSLQNWKKQFKALPARQVAQQRDILKKPWVYNLRTVRGRFEWIKAMNEEYSISELCAALEVTRSGYHAWRSRFYPGLAHRPMRCCCLGLRRHIRKAGKPTAARASHAGCASTDFAAAGCVA